MYLRMKSGIGFVFTFISPVPSDGTHGFYHKINEGDVMFYTLICVSGLWSHTHGYHYSYPTPPTIFPSSYSQTGTGSQYKYSWQTYTHKYEWSKANGDRYGKNATGPNHDTFPPSGLDSSEGINDNSQPIPENVSSDNDPMDPGRKNYTTLRPPTTRRTTTYRPAARPPSGPEPGTMSQPVPTLGELFAPSLQWHVGIYTKRFTPYMQVCGGSLVKADVVLSAAHCFWDDAVGALRAGLFAVAAGKLLRPWETEGEIYTQHSDIKQIKIPPRFQGVKTSFQDDIAIVTLSSSLEYAPGVKPICVSFDLETERRHLKSGNFGTIAGWGLTMPNGAPSQRLNFLKLPYVDIQECIRTAEPSFLKYITSDKICAGDQKTGRALCRGDSGGGLTYYSSTIPYLVGIASTAPRDDNQCNAYAVATFTYARAHSAFLLEHVPDIDKGCESLYDNGTANVKNLTIEAVTERMTVTEDPTIQENISKLGALLNVTTGERTSDVTSRSVGQVTNREEADQKMVMMSVESGERSVVRIPVEGASTLVCNCFCKN